MNNRKQTRLASVFAVLCAAMASATITQAQIVSNITGEIDLMLYPFFDNGWVWSDEANDFIYQPLVPQHRYTPVGFSDISTSFDGDGYYSAGGLGIFEYQYESKKPAEALLTFHAYADSLDRGDGAGGYSKLNMQITFSQPVQYRFEADVIDVPIYYEVSFNGRQADAWYDAMGIYGGTFPPTYHYDNPMPDGWDTYVDQGVLPAGTYDLSVAAYSSLHRYGIGLDSEGSASLYIRLLGDVNSNGRVGIEDLNRVLTHWNRTIDKPGSQQGDLNGDEFVGIEDLNQVLGNWNAKVRPPAAVVTIPEPTAGAALAGLLVITMTGRRLSRRNA